MVLCHWLPRAINCCFCISNFKLGCIIIALWTWFVAVGNSLRIIHMPMCDEQYTAEPLGEPLDMAKYPMTAINGITVLMCIIFLIALILNLAASLIADLFICVGFLHAFAMFVHGVVSVIASLSNGCDNPADGAIHIVLAFIWCYFSTIVNTFSAEQG